MCYTKMNQTTGRLSRWQDVYKRQVFSVEIPNFIELEVTQTEPGVKGNTATNTLKPATVETGAEIRVPLFLSLIHISEADRRAEHPGTVVQNLFKSFEQKTFKKR